jgi:hypothetical protein
VIGNPQISTMAQISRFALKHVECVHLQDGTWNLRVSIGLGEKIFIGEAISTTEECNFEAVALSTVISINKLLPGNVRVNLADAGQMYSSKASLSLFAVIIEIVENNNSSLVSGSSIVSIPMLHAPAKAVLNAVNRRLGRYLSNSEYLNSSY